MEMSSSDYVQGTQPRTGYLKGGVLTEDRMFAALVEQSAVGEDITAPIDSILRCKEFFSELHVVAAGAASVSPDYDEEKPLRGMYQGWKSDSVKLAKAGIRVVMHMRRFKEKSLGMQVRRLVKIPSICDFTKAGFVELLDQRLLPHFHTPNYRRRRYSLRGEIAEGSFSLWTPMVVTIVIFNWWRALFSQLWRTQLPTDVVIYPVNHADYGAFVPDERRTMRFYIPGLGFVHDRDPQYAIEDAAINYIPDCWTGWDRVVWMSQRTDFIGPLGLLGWLGFVWFVGAPWWNLVIPWLEVELFAIVRIAVWAVFSSAMLIVVNQVYKGPLQNLIIFFVVPFMWTPMIIIVIYAKTMSRMKRDSAGARLRRGRNRDAGKAEAEAEEEIPNAPEARESLD